MTLVSITEAAKLAGLSRPHFQTNYVGSGKITVDRSDPRKPKIDTAEIIRVFGKLHYDSNENDSKNSTYSNEIKAQTDELLQKIEKLEAEKAGLEKLADERKERLEEKNNQLAEKTKEINYQRERIHNLETRYDRLIEDKKKTDDLTAQLSEQLEILHFQRQKKWWQFW